MAELRVLIVTGLSGAGRTTALHALEDLGFYTTDNLPPELWRPLAERLRGVRDRLAIGVDVRTAPFLDALESALVDLAEAGFEPSVVFLDASDETLVRRYNLTRRTHPLGEGSLASDIASERAVLEPLRSVADPVLDTTPWTAKELTQAIRRRFGREDGFRLTLLSFGYKRGLPRDADAVIDVRSLPNPFYDPVLRSRPGTEAPVQAYVFTPAAMTLYSGIRGLVRDLAHGAAAEGRGSYTVAIGCTGGQHRSVAVAERLSHDLADRFGVDVEHRDLSAALAEHVASDAAGGA